MPGRSAPRAELGRVASGHVNRERELLRRAEPPIWPGSREPPASTPNPICAASSPGVPSTAWTHWRHGGRIWSCTSGGCRRSAPASPWWQGSTGPASSMTCWNTDPPSTSADPRHRRSHQPSGSRTCSSRHFSSRPASHRTSATSRWSRCSGCSACVSSRPPGRTLPTWVKSTAIGCCACAAKAPRSYSSRCHPQSAAPSTRPSAPAPAGRSCSTVAAPEWTVTLPPPPTAATRRDGGGPDRQPTPAHAQARSPPCLTLA